MQSIIELYLVLFVVGLTFGYVLQKYFRLPWMFTIVFTGLIFSAIGLFSETVKSDIFFFLSQIGMYALLFIIGLDLNLKEVMHLGKHIVIGNLLLVLTEGTLLASFFYFFFPQHVSNSFLIALIVGIAFATVGEILLLAILKEFNLVNTKIGQLTLGIGVFDDIFEILILAIVVSLPALSSDSAVSINPVYILLNLVGMGIATLIFLWLSPRIKKFTEKIKTPAYMPHFFILMLFFASIALGGLFFESLAAIGAIFGGIIANHIFADDLKDKVKNPFNFLGFNFLAPIFFFSLGYKMSLSSILSSPVLIIAIILISMISRVSVSGIYFKKLIGFKNALIMGVGLCVKFSTSVISETILVDSGYISPFLFSALMAAFILMKPIIVGIYSFGLSTIKDEKL